MDIFLLCEVIYPRFIAMPAGIHMYSYALHAQVNVDVKVHVVRFHALEQALVSRQNQRYDQQHWATTGFPVGTF